MQVTNNLVYKFAELNKCHFDELAPLQNQAGQGGELSSWYLHVGLKEVLPSPGFQGALVG